MTTRIRLTKKGRKNLPYYHVVVADSRSARDGKFIEKIGTYNPLLAKDNKDRFQIEKPKAEKWLSTGAIPTETVAKLMIKAGVKGAEKHKPVFVPKKKKVEVKEEAKTEEKPVETKEEVKEEPKAE
jgi:small subunit ribosomal protein S16